MIKPTTRHLFRAAFANALIATLAILPLPRAAHAMEPVTSQPFSARYEVRRNGRALGEANLTLARGSNDSWRFESETRGTRGVAAITGVRINERSTFRWRGLLPELIEYDYQQSVAMRRRERSLRIEPERNAVVSRQDDRSWELRFEEGVADRSAVVLGVIAAVAAGQTDLSFRVADRDDVETQRYRLAGREQVQVPAGTFEAIRVERIREKPGRESDILLAPALGYLPVSIRHREEDGESIEMRLVSHDLDVAAATAPPARR
jgi:hypothetical protein